MLERGGANSDLAFLVIEQAMYGTEVWLNGSHLGGDIACYTSQEYDIRRALHHESVNSLLVRVGSRSSLPAESAVGRDQERSSFPMGIWGDVRLVRTGNPRVALVQVIPHIREHVAEVRLWVENRHATEVRCELRGVIREAITQRESSVPAAIRLSIPPNETAFHVFYCPLAEMHLWLPDGPFLYEFIATTSENREVRDVLGTRFGMREFAVRGSEFLLNGERIFLLGGNIAFHRFLSDTDRQGLPWNVGWAKKILIDIPKAHNFNFFRSHLGQMYNRWYDIADEHGMLLQNEWPFWTTSGSQEQITREFTRWLQDNWNHPSIIIWDALNETSDSVVQHKVVPAMKDLDPTRPWESVDFVEEHPYVYSLGPVLNERRFGFARSLADIERSSTPSMLNEFLWWWLDKDNEPAPLTKEVLERWLGPVYTKEEIIERQSFLAQELVELFRRMDVDAIQPFIYLSNHGGPTGNWFDGNIAECRPKAVMSALRNAFSPFGVSLELWDRHFFEGEKRRVRIFVFNDMITSQEGTLEYGLCDLSGHWVSRERAAVFVRKSGHAIIESDLEFPRGSGEYRAVALLHSSRGIPSARSEKIVYVLPEAMLPEKLNRTAIALLEKGSEIGLFLGERGINTVPFGQSDFSHTDLIVLGDGMVSSSAYQNSHKSVEEAVLRGACLLVQEPEFGVTGRVQIKLVGDLDLDIEQRKDVDKGGYDSYVFPVDSAEPVWHRILPEHLRMFNGGFGGEMVSEHRIGLSLPEHVMARCGLKLGIVALMECRVGKGRVVISRIQTRGRLVASGHTSGLYERRVDPVAQQFVLNLVEYTVANVTK